MKAKDVAWVAIALMLAAGCTAQSANTGRTEMAMSSMTSIDGLRGPSAPKGVADSELESIDLAKEVPGMQGRRLRARRVTVEPGGIVPIHSHAERPAMLYILEGTIVEHRSDRAQPVVHRAGDLAVETDVTHWWANESDARVVIVATDIVRDGGTTLQNTAAAATPGALDGPSTPRGFDARVLGSVDLAGQIDGVEGRELRLRFVTVKAGGIAPVHSHADRPALFYILEGEIVENRSDALGSVLRKAGDVTKAENGVAHWWENTTGKDVSILVTDIFNTTSSGQAG